MSPISTTVTAMALVAVSESVKLSVKALHDFLTTKSKKLAHKNQIEKSIENLYKHVDAIRHVKTIWQIDKSVNLKEFYVLPHIQIKGEKRQKISSIDDINGNSILIEGIAGQGKSTFMRQLCSNEMIEGSRIPIFIELRKIKSGETLIDHVIQYLSILNIDLTKEQTIGFIKIGKTSLYLDGFDETEHSLRGDLIREIEMISLIQGDSRLIVTSRPGQTIRSMACLKIVKLDHLRGDEYKEVINKISEDKEYSESLISVVENHKKNIKELLCTPLFVTLLVISYKSYQQIPGNLSDFYDSLFRVLLQRHDGTKPGYSRPRACSLNDSKFREAFETFCYFSKKYKNHVIDQTEILNLINAAIEQSNINVDPHDLLKDISDVTCLIINDGEEWRFIHKSIQEYFSASHIKTTPEIKAQKIYQKLASSFNAEWEAELKFLSEIDEYRYAKYFFIPCFKKLIENPSNLESTNLKITPQIIKNVLGCYKTEVEINANNEFQCGIEIIAEQASPLNLFEVNALECIFELIDKKYIQLFKKEAKAGSLKEELTIHSIMADAADRKIATEYVNISIRALHQKGLAYEKMIKRVETENIDQDLFS